MTLTDWWRIYKPLPPFEVLTFHSDKPIQITSIRVHPTCVFFYDHAASDYFDGKNLIFKSAPPIVNEIITRHL